MTVAEEKADERALAFKRRAKADPSARDAANAHLNVAIRASTGHVVAGYWPIRTEIDPRPTMTALSESHAWCLPVVVGQGLPLAFRPWTPGAEMVDGAFGTSWPASEEAVAPDILVVPMSAFDMRGYRLGYGGGFYDRTLEALRAQGQVTAIGFAYSIQETTQVPTEPTDQPLDLIVTELGIAPVR
ncbi:MAG: 5-formyltetrahydrofolate cyclo-ligase [Silicimonas sp.]|nr:5-formyltetrahydrofolate cyclo-ligase [Silicimonas sp.]